MTPPEDKDFLLPAADFEPAYLALHRRGELVRRAERAVASLESCRTCPHLCEANRLAGETGTCGTGRYAGVSSCGPHHGEEDVLRGRAGSGTIFFAQCNLHCVFCQNYDISHGDTGRVATSRELAGAMLGLQALGCHNINFVTPSHVVPQILEALPEAVDGGLNLPLVYNTSGYDSLETLRMLEGVVDVYMPDFKMWDPAAARLYLHAEDYPDVARAALREMHRQVGVLRLDERGLARRGVLVRHLVLPAGLAGTPHVMAFLARELSPDTYVNLMAQYHPAGEVGPGRFGEMARRITRDEFAEALVAARSEGLHRFD
jgi:putative pyruvate formate lyase activating enzyme